MYRPLNKCFLLLLQYAGQKALQGFVLFSTIGVLYVVMVLRLNGACVTFILSWSEYTAGVFH